MTYAEKLKDPRWQRKRLYILDRDNFTCIYCGDSSSTLHVHHKKYFGEPWEAEDKELETCCQFCHKVIEQCKKDSPESKILKIRKTFQEDMGVMRMIGFAENNEADYSVIIYAVYVDTMETIWITNIHEKSLYGLVTFFESEKEKIKAP